MTIRQPGCPICAQLTSGDCGQHGPIIVTATQPLSGETPERITMKNEEEQDDQSRSDQSGRSTADLRDGHRGVHERALVNAVVMAWHRLRVEQVDVYGPVKIDHSGRCGAEMNTLMRALEALATCGATFSTPVGYHGTLSVGDSEPVGPERSAKENRLNPPESLSRDLAYDHPADEEPTT